MRPRNSELGRVILTKDQEFAVDRLKSGSQLPLELVRTVLEVRSEYLSSNVRTNSSTAEIRTVVRKAFADTDQQNIAICMAIFLTALVRWRKAQTTNYTELRRAVRRTQYHRLKLRDGVKLLKASASFQITGKIEASVTFGACLAAGKDCFSLPLVTSWYELAASAPVPSKYARNEEQRSTICSNIQRRVSRYRRLGGYEKFSHKAYKELWLLLNNGLKPSLAVARW